MFKRSSVTKMGLKLYLILVPACFTFLLLSSFLNTNYHNRECSHPPESKSISKKGKLPLLNISRENLRKSKLNLPSGITEHYSDFFLRRLVGDPMKDFEIRPRALLAIAVGFNQREDVDQIINKFPPNDFSLVLFHYDNKISEWGQFEWFKRSIHIGVSGQTKWWFAKRFLHPDIVKPYDFIFVWDEDLDVSHFNASKYLQIITENGLEISQPALGGHSPAYSWPITVRQTDSKGFHHALNESCFNENGTTIFACTSFVEIMAPVFSRRSWECVWHMIQNDLVHGWGMDLHLSACVEGEPLKKMGIVDSEYVIHKGIPSLLGNEDEDDYKRRISVKQRSYYEWKEFERRWYQMYKE